MRPFLAGLLVVLATLPVACKKPANPVAAAAPSSVPVVDTAEAIERARGGVVAVEQELTKRYLELDQRRLRLAKASPAEVAAYNRDAATYSADRAALQRRQESVKRLEQADVVRRQDVSGEEVSAQQTLGHLRAAITIGDWPAQVGAMEQALAQHRNTQTFAQISALAKPRLAAATYAELEKAMLKSAPAALVAPRNALTGSAALVQQLRSIVNQPIQPVPKGSERVGVYNFHPGGSPLDYERVTRDELWKDRQIFPQPLVEPQSHPGVYYRTEDVEFNIRLKWYYSDPTHPTRRLAESDYDRIIEVCRRIAQAEKAGPPTPPAAATPAPASARPNPTQTWSRLETLKRNWPQ